MTAEQSTTETVMQTVADCCGLTFTMDSYDEETGAESGGVVKYPANNVQNNIGTEDVDENGIYRCIYCESYYSK